MRLRVATYNIHRCLGTDGRMDVGRVAAVLEEVDADVLGLQEVESRPGRSAVNQAEELAQRLGMQLAEGPLLLAAQGHFGNAVLSRLPLKVIRRRRFARHGREPRGFVHGVVTTPAGQGWHVIVTHLGLGPAARGEQLRALAREFSFVAPPAVLMGDLNEWRAWTRSLAAVRRVATMLPSPPSFPSRYPLLRLDRIALRGAQPLVPCRVHQSALSRVASDHLPVIADLGLDGATEPRPGSAR